MKALIVYDSQFGNTEKVAQAMGAALEGDIKVVKASEADPASVAGQELLVICTPTQGFRPLAPVQAFINGISRDALKGARVAVFDTRFPKESAGRFLRFVMKMGGYAAPRMARDLEKKGGVLAVPPEGFFVMDKKGPLVEGELERAGEWIKVIIAGK